MKCKFTKTLLSKQPEVSRTKRVKTFTLHCMCLCASWKNLSFSPSGPCFVLQFYNSSQVKIFIVFPYYFPQIFCSISFIIAQTTLNFEFKVVLQLMLLSLSQQFLLNENFLSSRILLSLLVEKLGGRKQHCDFSWNVMHTLSTHYILQVIFICDAFRVNNKPSCTNTVKPQ